MICGNCPSYRKVAWNFGECKFYKKFIEADNYCENVAKELKKLDKLKEAGG